MTALVDDVTELLILWPHLAAALERDAGASVEPVVSGGNDPAFGLPVNADVLGALAHLRREVPFTAAWACGVVAEPWVGRDVEGHLRHMPRWHERMLVTAAADDAGRLAAAVRSMLRDVKLALGLRTPDRALGQFCPMHDEPLREMIAPGSEARLRYTRLDRAGRPIMPAVEWTRHDAAVCRYCGASWAPSQYLGLGRLLREADARRVQENLRSTPSSSGTSAGNLAAEGAS